MVMMWQYYYVWVCAIMIMITITLIVTSMKKVVLYMYRRKKPSSSSTSKSKLGNNIILPPGSMGLPFIGETLSFLVIANSIDIHPFVKERMKRYGPLFKTRLAGRPIVVSSDPDFNYLLFQQEGKLVELWYLDSFAKLFDMDSTGASGYVHKYLRHLTLNHFGVESLKHKLLPTIQHAIDRGLQDWAKLPEVELKHQLAAIILEFTAKQLISYEPENSESIGPSFTNFLQGMMSFPLYFPGTAFYRCAKIQQKIIKLITEIVEERMACYPEGCKGDLLDQLVEDMKRETFLTTEFTAHVIFGLLLASFETISSTIALAINYLSDHPSLLHQLTEEHEEILRKREDGNLEDGLLWTEYKSMTFTHCVINESLRLASVAPGILRRVINDIHFNGYTIPKGWSILVVPAALQLNPDAFEDPLTFNPSRWKNIGSNATAKNFIAFGGGNRTCAGAEFSKVIMAVFLHVLVTKYRWTKIKGGDVVRTPALGFPNGIYIKVSEK